MDVCYECAEEEVVVESQRKSAEYDEGNLVESEPDVLDPQIPGTSADYNEEGVESQKIDSCSDNGEDDIDASIIAKLRALTEKSNNLNWMEVDGKTYNAALLRNIYTKAS
jgi:hypothetical protein